MDKDCAIIVDTPPVFLSIKQGSIWGISPRTAKKIINYSFTSKQSRTQIRYSSEFAPDWKKLTIVGYIFSFLLIGLSLWISIGLQNYILTGNPGFWAWIAKSNSTSLSLAQSLSNLTRILALLLIAVLAVETFIVLYSYYKINDSAEEILNDFYRET